MALPLKTGADLYNQQLIRARLQNLGAQPNTADVGLGQVYFNTGTNTAASLRIGYCYETGSVPKFHHVANLEDINRLEELISALSGSSSESVASVLGRVITLEGYFSNGKAKDADLLDGHNSDYFATATTVSDLLEDYEAFKAVFSDNSDDYINTWTEVKDFLDGIKNTEDLNAILLGINTELGDKADKATTLAGYGITDAVRYNSAIDISGETLPLNEVGYGFGAQGWYTNGPAMAFGYSQGFWMQMQLHYAYGLNYRQSNNGAVSDWVRVLDANNYAAILDTSYLKLNGGGYVKGKVTIEGELGLTEQILMRQHYFFVRPDSDADWVVTTKNWGKEYSLLHMGNYSNLITALNGNLSVGGNISLQNTGQLRYDNKEVIQYVASNNSLYIGYGTAGSSEAWNTSVWGNNIKLINKSGATLLHAKDSNDVTIGYLDALSILSNQDVHIKGNLIVDGQVSSGGIGSEGSGSGASGIVILEDWEKYDDTLAQVLGAGLGVGLRDKIAALESKATNVSVAQTLTSGKEIGAITIDGVATKLFAPDDYLPLSGGTLDGRLKIRNFIQFNPDSGSEYIIGWQGGRLAYYNATSWNAILHEGNYATTLDNAYLKLTGGMINTGDIAGLTIYRSNSKYSMIHFCNNEGNGLVDVGYLGVVGEGVPVYLNSGGSQFNLLHAGNFNSYAPTLTGTGASGTWGIDISGKAAKLTNNYVNNLDNAPVDAMFASGFRASNLPATNYATGFTLENPTLGRYVQFAIDADAKAHIRQKGTTWYAWKTLAFTDSNVASATKLQTARTIWGQSFDGTADVSGTLYYVNNIYPNSEGERYIGTSSNPFKFMYAEWYGAGAGKTLSFGANNGTHLFVNTSGNVTIGSSDLALTNHKLYVSGGLTRINSGLQVKGHTSFFAEANDAYVTSFYTHEGGLTIQPRIEDVGYTDIILNPSGGKVGIGTLYPEAKLHVKGNIRLTGELAFMDGYSIQSYNNTPLSINKQGNDVLLCELGAGSVGIGTTAPRYKLDVIGNVNVSSRLLVGGASDDGINALQVHGDIALRRGVSSAIGAPYDNNNPTIYNRIVFDGATYGIRYYSGGWTSSVVDSHTFYVGLNNDAALIIKNNKDVHISGNLIVDGQVSSGGVAEAGTGGATGGSGLDRLVFEIPANTTSFPCEHGLGTRDISVSIYEKGNDFQQVLADVYLDSTNVARIVFGAATDVAHKVVIIG